MNQTHDKNSIIIFSNPPQEFGAEEVRQILLLFYQSLFNHLFKIFHQSLQFPPQLMIKL